MQKKSIIKLSKLAVPYVSRGRFNKEKKTNKINKKKWSQSNKKKAI